MPKRDPRLTQYCLVHNLAIDYVKRLMALRKWRKAGPLVRGFVGSAPEYAQEIKKSKEDLGAVVNALVLWCDQHGMDPQPLYATIDDQPDPENAEARAVTLIMRILRRAANIAGIPMTELDEFKEAPRSVQEFAKALGRGRETEDADELNNVKDAVEQIRPADAKTNPPQSAGVVRGEPADEKHEVCHSRQVAWSDNAEGYLPNSEAIKLAKKLSLSRLSTILKPNGPIRYMRKPGQRCMVNIHDFRAYLRQTGDHVADAAADAMAEEFRKITASKSRPKQ